MNNGLPWLIGSQLVATLALLAFAFFQDDLATKQLVIGGVMGHWFSESSRLGRQVYETKKNEA